MRGGAPAQLWRSRGGRRVGRWRRVVQPYGDVMWQGSGIGARVGRGGRDGSYITGVVGVSSVTPQVRTVSHQRVI